MTQPSARNARFPAEYGDPGDAGLVPWSEVEDKLRAAANYWLATVNPDGSVSASVRPEQIATNDPLGNVRGTSLAIHFELDTIPGLTIVSHRPNLQSTAYGLLADFINAVK